MYVIIYKPVLFEKQTQFMTALTKKGEKVDL